MSRGKNNIAPEFWEYVRGQNTKVAQRVYKWLDYDNLGAIMVDGDVFWIELTSGYATLPVYIMDYIKAWCKRQGFTYLYDKVK